MLTRAAGGLVVSRIPVLKPKGHQTLLYLHFRLGERAILKRFLTRFWNNKLQFWPERLHVFLTNGVIIAQWLQILTDIAKVATVLHCKSGPHKNGIRKSSRKTYDNIMGI
jgi:hypothetical protein